MSSLEGTTNKPESLKKRIGRGFRELVGKKKASQTPTSDSSRTFHVSETAPIETHVQNPSFIIEESISPVVEPVADASPSLYLDDTLHSPNAQSRQSLTSHRFEESLNSNPLAPYYEKQWKMAYDIAIKELKLSEDERSQIDSDLKPSTVHSFLDAANKALADRENDKWRYTKKNGEVVILREILDKIIEVLGKYAVFIGKTVQHQHLDVTGLVWGAAESLLEIYLDHKESVKIIEESLKTIAVSMANCEFYASIFSGSLSKLSTDAETSAAWEKQLERALPEFYAAILVFSIKVKGHFTQSTIGRVTSSIKPFSTIFQLHLTAIENKERTLKELAGMATMEGVKDLRQKLDIVWEMREMFVQISNEKALTWLHAIPPDPVYDFNKSRRLEGTCQWVFETQTYQTWLGGSGSRDLWVVGIPGAGKSVLATSIIDNLRENPDFLTLYFFFRDGDPLTVSSLEMVACLIAQLMKTGIDKERLMRILKLQVQSSSFFMNTETEPRNLGKLCATFLEMLRGFPIPVIVILDALDECTDPSSVVRHLLEPATDLSSISQMMLMPNIGEEIHVQFLITGRPNVPDIFAILPYMSTIGMEVNKDIHKFINETVAGNKSLQRHESQIIATIYENSQGMFRYAALVLDELTEPSHETITERLKAMPKGITGMYGLILHRLGSKGSEGEHKMRRKILVWVTLALRPIGVSEMQCACVTFEGHKSFDPDLAILPTEEQIKAYCGPLIKVFNNGQLRFTHRTVKEFLLQPQNTLPIRFQEDERVTSCMVNEVEGHAWMAMICVTQLFSNHLNELPPTHYLERSHDRNNDETTSLSGTPFGYAISYWFEHAMEVARQMEDLSGSKELWKLLRDFFWDRNSAFFIRWFKAFAPQEGYSHKLDLESISCHICLPSSQLKRPYICLHAVA